MQIDRFLYPVTSLGPGNRLCIWTVGCKKRCPMCANPELRRFDKSKELSMPQIKKMLEKIDFSKIDGVTISGGEPFCQSKDLYEFLKIIRTKCEDILIFTGYTYEELMTMKDIYVDLSMDYISMLVAGEYVNHLNDNKTPLLASTNQEMICFEDSLQKRYLDYQKQGRQIQNVYMNDEMMSVGIHNREE